MTCIHFPRYRRISITQFFKASQVKTCILNMHKLLFSPFNPANLLAYFSKQSEQLIKYLIKAKNMYIFWTQGCESNSNYLLVDYGNWPNIRINLMQTGFPLSTLSITLLVKNFHSYSCVSHLKFKYKFITNHTCIMNLLLWRTYF